MGGGEGACSVFSSLSTPGVQKSLLQAPASSLSQHKTQLNPLYPSAIAVINIKQEKKTAPIYGGRWGFLFDECGLFLPFLAVKIGVM